MERSKRTLPAIMKSEYESIQLSENPIQSFLSWLKNAESAGVPDPIAMTLATATQDGEPNARVVLFKGVSPSPMSKREGIDFYTNYTSPKSHELEENPRATAVFYWAPLLRQVRISGRVEKMDADASANYFKTRPRGSQIGAWASPQSEKIGSRHDLDERVKQKESEYSGQEVPCPPFWGGWRLVPDKVEFWHGQKDRLHDRFLYEWNEDHWQISRMAP